MGIGNHGQGNRFGPQDLDILDGPTPRSFRTIVDLCATAVAAPISLLCIFDDAKTALFLRASHGLDQDQSHLGSLPLSQSAASLVRAKGRTARIPDLREASHNTLIENRKFNGRSYLGSLVRGPAEESIGVLAVLHKTPHSWTYREARVVEDMAYLLSQQIMLKASFATLRIMSDERRQITK